MSVWHWAFIALIVSALSAIAKAIRAGSAERADSMFNVSGWLALLIASLGVVAPLLNALSLNTGFGAAEALTPGLAGAADWSTYKTGCWSALTLASLVGIYAAFELAFTRNVGAVTAAIVAVWGAGPGLSLGLSLLAPALVFGHVQVTAGDAARLVSSVLLAAAWTAYLLKSQRVKMRYTDGLLPDPRRA